MLIIIDLFKTRDHALSLRIIMITSPHELSTLAFLIFFLGVKHGLDADHLAAIDGLTRANSRRRPRLARLAGMLFSLGHGTIVFAVAGITSTVATSWQVPSWLDAFGAWISIVVLLVLALVNIFAVATAQPHEQVSIIGWRTGLFKNAVSVDSAPLMFGLGAIFALSFDTMSQAALFSVASSQFGGFKTAMFLAGLFVFGMLLADGANGLWIAKLIKRTDRTSRLASRTMGLTVAGIGLLTAALGVAFQLDAHAQQWGEGKELWFGAAIILIMLLSYAVSMRLAKSAMAKSLVTQDDSIRYLPKRER